MTPFPQPRHAPVEQASQQLANWPMHAALPFRGTHLVALRLSEHLVFPVLVVRQHVT
jgi:hypothetical protein